MKDFIIANLIAMPLGYLVNKFWFQYTCENQLEFYLSTLLIAYIIIFLIKYTIKKLNK